MKDSSEFRQWAALDYSIEKTVLVEGDFTNRNTIPKLGYVGTFDIIEYPESAEPLKSIEYFGKLSSMLTGSRTVTFKIGTGSSQIDRKIEEVLCSMFLGEESRINFRIKLNLTKNGTYYQNKDYFIENIKLDDFIWLPIELRIKLTTLNGPGPIYEWSPETKYNFALELSGHASKLFGSGRSLDAFIMYRKILSVLLFVSDHAPSEELKWASVNNMIACHFKWGNYNHVVEFASIYLDNSGNPKDIKTLYRRGVSFLEKNDFTDCKNDLQLAHSLDPENKAIISKLNVLKTKSKAYADLMKKRLEKMMFASK